MLITVINTRLQAPQRLGFCREIAHDRRMPKRGRSYVNQSVSFPPRLLLVWRICRVTSWLALMSGMMSNWSNTSSYAMLDVVVRLSLVPAKPEVVLLGTGT